MALTYLDSCGDTYSVLADRWTVTGSPTIGSSVGRRDTNGIRLTGTGQRLQKDVSGLATRTCGVAFKLDTLAATDVLTLREGTTDHLIVRVTANGAVELLRAPSTQLAISSAGLVVAGFFQYLEIEATINDSTGAYDVDLNGSNVLTGTSADTQNGGTGVIDNIEIEGSSGNLTIDDFYIGDTTGSAPQNTRLGDTAVTAVTTQGDGNTNNWPTLQPASPSTHFDKVDDIPPDDDTSYLASETSDDLELFDMQDLPDPGGVSAIYGVQLGLYARKDKTTFRAIKGVTRVGGTNYDGADFTLTGAYGFGFSLFDDDPDTMAQWLESGINAAEFGSQVL